MASRPSAPEATCLVVEDARRSEVTICVRDAALQTCSCEKCRLGDDERGTGYDEILWIEEAVALRGFRPPRLEVHSANTSARIKMEAGIRAIQELDLDKN